MAWDWGRGRHRRRGRSGGRRGLPAADRLEGGRCPRYRGRRGRRRGPRPRGISTAAMVCGAPQKLLRPRWMVWKPGPSAGSRTAPAMQPPVFGVPMICSGPGAGPAGGGAAAASKSRMGRARTGLGRRMALLPRFAACRWVAGAWRCLVAVCSTPQKRRGVRSLPRAGSIRRCHASLVSGQIVDSNTVFHT